jgi:hypothetical protein
MGVNSAVTEDASGENIALTGQSERWRQGGVTAAKTTAMGEELAGGQ